MEISSYKQTGRSYFLIGTQGSLDCVCLRSMLQPGANVWPCIQPSMSDFSLLLFLYFPKEKKYVFKSCSSLCSEGTGSAYLISNWNNCCCPGPPRCWDSLQVSHCCTSWLKLLYLLRLGRCVYFVHPPIYSENNWFSGVGSYTFLFVKGCITKWGQIVNNALLHKTCEHE